MYKGCKYTIRTDLQQQYNRPSGQYMARSLGVKSDTSWSTADCGVTGSNRYLG